MIQLANHRQLQVQMLPRCSTPAPCQPVVNAATTYTATPHDILHTWAPVAAPCAAHHDAYALNTSLARPYATAAASLQQQCTALHTTPTSLAPCQTEVCSNQPVARSLHHRCNFCQRQRLRCHHFSPCSSPAPSTAGPPSLSTKHLPMVKHACMLNSLHARRSGTHSSRCCHTPGAGAPMDEAACTDLTGPALTGHQPGPGCSMQAALRPSQKPMGTHIIKSDQASRD